MLIVDGHLDLAWNAVAWNRDLARPVAELRTQPYVEIAVVQGQPLRGDLVPTVALPEMRRGGVGLCFTTLLARSTGRPVAHIDYASPAQAEAAALGQLAYYRALEREGLLRAVRDRAALERHLAEWEGPAAGNAPVGYVLAMEGADPIRDPGDLERWHREGLRALGLSHYGPGRYAGGTGTTGGLTALGPPLLAAMRRLGMILDVTHLSDPAFDEALGAWDGPVMASHLNCRALVPHQRQGSDAQLRELIRRDAVIGAVLDAWMLAPDWERAGAARPRVTLETVADHVDHVCQLAGDARHAAVGSDLDGGFGKAQSPEELDTIADLARLEDVLRRRGYADGDVAAVLHGNWLRLLRGALPA